MSSRSRCKAATKNCDRCVTGMCKRPARRKDRREAKRALRRTE